MSRFCLLATLTASVLLLAACSRVGDDWRAAQAADTTEAYQEFLQQHTDSEFGVQAQARIKQLAEDRDWQQASALDTRDAYEQFVAQHADGKWAQEARVRIENFQLSGGSPAPAAAAPVVAATPAPAAKPAPATKPVPAAKPAPAAGGASARTAPGGNYYAQLGAFSTRARAEAEWQRLHDKLAPLKSLQPHYASGQSQSQTVYRLQVGMASEQRAREFCAALKKLAQACVPVIG
jgi:cell division septation protein DedD